MTSLDFFQPTPAATGVPPEWGTGKMKDSKIENLWIPRAPTWHQDGNPIEQDYTLTQLKLSNVRTNDQLVENPQHVVMANRSIDLPFPAEHPFLSHQSQKAVFPNFNSPYDPKRGVKAQKHKPLHEEIPSQPHRVVIVSKTKGNPLRYEEQQYDLASKRDPLHWPDQNFNQVLKGPTYEKPQFYPTPPKTYVPNMEERDDGKVLRGHMVTSARTSTALRNVERDQWITSYDRNHTGLGPANAMELDNFENKKILEATHNIHNSEVDKLQPRAMNTFDPARPLEGRTARALVPRPAPQTNRFPPYQKDTSYSRPMTLTEKEEHRLLHGKEYVNLPTDRSHGEWEQLESMQDSDHGLPLLMQRQGEGQPDRVPYQPAGPPPPRDTPVTELARQVQHDRVQQMEAENRWKVLQSEKPDNNLTALRNKMGDMPGKEHPQVFYNHEGQFQTERAGMYKTSYDPYKLQYEMNKEEESGRMKFDMSNSHADVLNMPVQLNTDFTDVMRYNRAFGGSRSVPPGLSTPTPFEAVEPLAVARQRQKQMIQPSLKTAATRVQEGSFITTESEMGETYNTQKFLQEYALNELARNDPQALMSLENQDLNVVRMNAVPKNPKSSTKKVRFSLEVDSQAAPVQPSGPRVNTSRFEPVDLATALDLPQPFQEKRPKVISSQSGFYSARPGHVMATDLFASKSSNITASPGLNYPNQYKSTYQSLQYAPKPAVDMSYKDDEMFRWSVGSGMPRPQTSLLRLQNSFVKTDVRKKFLDQFPERNPDLRENIIYGKKHSFLGMNAQILRGTEVKEDC